MQSWTQMHYLPQLINMEGFPVLCPQSVSKCCDFWYREEFHGIFGVPFCEKQIAHF